MILDYLTQTWVGWTILGSPLLIGLFAIAYYFPPFRRAAVVIGTLGIAALVIYKPGQQDAKARQKALSDKKAKEMQDEYSKIVKRPTPPGDTVDKLQRGNF